MGRCTGCGIFDNRMTPLPSWHRRQSRVKSGADRQQLALLDQLGNRLRSRNRSASRRQGCALFIDEGTDTCFAAIRVDDGLGKQLRFAREPCLQTLLPSRANRIDDALCCFATPNPAGLCEQALRFRIAYGSRYIIGTGSLPSRFSGAALCVAARD